MVPVLVESGRNLFCNRPQGHEVNILEIDAVLSLEVLVPNISTAHDRHGVVNNECLVVHPFLGPFCSKHIVKRA